MLVQMSLLINVWFSNFRYFPCTNKLSYGYSQTWVVAAAPPAVVVAAGAAVVAPAAAVVAPAPAKKNY